MTCSEPKSGGSWHLRESEASRGPGRGQSPLVMETGMTLPRGVVAERQGWSESRVTGASSTSRPVGVAQICSIAEDPQICNRQTEGHYPEVPAENFPEVAT